MDIPEKLLALSPAAPVRRRTRSRTSSRRERRSARFERWRERRIYRLTERLEQRRDRLADRRAHLSKTGHRGGLWTRFRGWLLSGAERLELLDELLLIRWNRFLLHLSARWERLPGPASRGGAVAAAGVSLTLAFAVVVMLPLRNAERVDSGSTPIVLPGTEADIAPTREASAPSTPAATPPSTALGAWEEHANLDLGYRFSYPSDWDIDESSEATVLSDSADQVVIEFLRAPPGRLTTASDQLVEQVTAPFSGFARLATETARTEQGYPSTSVGGTARDAVGTSIQLVVTTIRGPDGNHAIVVRFPASDPGDLDAVVEVIGSFRLV
ncbi:MAG TPA: hypothetical protein VFI35_05530 [Actinomycetota bacterium]|nr:hypothetical protein [Actinomycetota bacterium]